jgi:hypothetical protein
VHRPDVRVYVGKGGCGKSTLARSHLPEPGRVLIHDFNGETAHAEGAHVVTDRAQLLELLIRPGPVRVCWRPYVGASDAAITVDLFEWANRCAWAAGDLWLIWDEVDRLTAGRLEGKAYQIVNQGRHRDLRVLASSRRPRWVPRDLTASATMICAFRTTEPRDVDYLRDTMGEAARQLPVLGEHEYLRWMDDGQVARQR